MAVKIIIARMRADMKERTSYATRYPGMLAIANGGRTVNEEGEKTANQHHACE